MVRERDLAVVVVKHGASAVDGCARAELESRPGRPGGREPSPAARRGPVAPTPAHDRRETTLRGTRRPRLHKSAMPLLSTIGQATPPELSVRL